SRRRVPSPASAPHRAAAQAPTRSLHDALPIFRQPGRLPPEDQIGRVGVVRVPEAPFRMRREESAVRLRLGMPRHEGLPVRMPFQDRKSTRLNSSHVKISYAVFCLKKKKRLLNK